MKLFRSLVLAFTVATIATMSAPAQTSGAWPITPGETLTYEGKLDKILPGWTVADLTFTYDKDPNSDDLLIKADATSKGTLLKIIRFSFRQNYESLVENGTYRVLRTTKFDEQNDRVRIGEAVFDYKDQRVTYVETDPKDPNRPPRRIASELTSPMHDIVTGLYFLRTLPLAVGKRFMVDVSDSGLVYRIPVNVTAREKQKSIFGKVWCYRIEPQIFGKGRIIEQKGSMIIWITDDARRIPVRSRIKTQLGKVEVKLRSATNSHEMQNVGNN